MGQVSRHALKAAVWENLEPAMEGYTNLIELLLDLLTEEQLREVADVLRGVGRAPDAE